MPAAPPSQPARSGARDPRSAPGAPARPSPAPPDRRRRPSARRRRRAGGTPVPRSGRRCVVAAARCCGWSSWSPCRSRVDARSTRSTPSPTATGPATQPGTTYLLVGSDSRAGLTAEERKELGTGNAAASAPTRSCCCTPAPGPNLLMSIPRDSLVDDPRSRHRRRSTRPTRSAARSCWSRTIEHEHRHPDRRLRRDRPRRLRRRRRRGRRHRDLPDAGHERPLANLDIKKGCQEADGEVALGYARSRHASSSSATSTGPSTSARSSPRSATRRCRRGRSSTRSATGTPRWRSRELLRRQRGHRSLLRRAGAPGGVSARRAGASRAARRSLTAVPSSGTRSAREALFQTHHPGRHERHR